MYTASQRNLSVKMQKELWPARNQWEFSILFLWNQNFIPLLMLSSMRISNSPHAMRIQKHLYVSTKSARISPKT